MPGVNSYDEVVVLLKRGAIIKYIPSKVIIKVRLANTQSLRGQTPSVLIDVPMPHSMFYNNGMYIGTQPQEGTPVVIGQGSGGQYFFVSYLAEDLPNIPDLNLGEILIRSNEDTKITLNSKNSIVIGSDLNKIHIDTSANLITTNFYNENHFTQASRKVEGVVKRDLLFNIKFDQDSKLESDDYDPNFKIIGMDPSSSSNNAINGATKNPPFVENREMTYEFQYISGVTNDVFESVRYGTEKPTPLDFSFPNRRKSRADTLSLSLVEPNYLIETIKGTVVDIFGNILDINRYPLPIGKDQNTINKDQSKDKVQSFISIKALERKSLAYHFEINARKDLTGKNGTIALPDFNSNADYSRSRSRFFMDIDKEGQFKLNVPASSETGNIPLLTRYENYSTFGDDDNGNPNKLVYRTDNLDIYQDSFAAGALTASDGGFLPASDGSRGSIQLKGGDGGDAAPLDRITSTSTTPIHIKHGTVFHDILQTCFLHQNSSFLNYQAGEVSPLTVDLSTIPLLTNVVSKTITVSGTGANAGGRSGSLNFDGSLEFNVGANTVDRQSLWLDTAGGIVANIGRDINGRSIVAATGGDFFLQVGGFGVLGDSRFTTANNSIKSATLDLRVMGAGGFCHLFRIDDTGVTIMTPGALKMHSKGDMVLTSDKDIRLECNTLTMQQRLHMKTFGGSS